MNVAGRVALAGVGVAAGGYGAVRLNQSMIDDFDERIDVIHRDTAVARQEWDRWERALQAEFPGRTLNTPEDHRRFEAFLARNPQPDWIEVTHADRNRIYLEKSKDFLSSDAQPDPEETVPYAIGFGAMATAMGGFSVVQGVRGATKRFPVLALATIGGGMMALGSPAFAAAMVKGTGRADDAYDGAHKLQSEVYAYSPPDE